jgi:recombination protein RecA
MERATEEGRVGNYFSEPKPLEFFSSGCQMLDLALGGGWPLGRISNVVGDKSTGKTGLAIEACANFYRTFPNGKIFYREAEAAWDDSYSQALGMPKDKVDFGDEEGNELDFYTVEDLFEDLEKVLKALPDDTPALYIIDSLDALSDREELEREIDKGTMGARKAKLLSQLFRRLTKRLNKKRTHVMFISQIRDNINSFGFGRKTSRSGGHALDFYCSQIAYLTRIKTLKNTKKGVERATGIKIEANIDKNKVGLPYREGTFEIKFGWGIDDFKASLDWLEEIKRLDIVGDKKAGEVIKELEKMDETVFAMEVSRIRNQVDTLWREIENSFLPQKRKYN